MIETLADASAIALIAAIVIFACNWFLSRQATRKVQRLLYEQQKKEIELDIKRRNMDQLIKDANKRWDGITKNRNGNS